MSLVSVSRLKRLAAREMSYRKKSAGAILTENAYASFSEDQTYDVFLSHSYSDKQTIAGLKLLLEHHHLSVYVDWVEDQQLDRTQVNKRTAETLIKRMDSCRCLLYARTFNSENSKWMPWELGYFHGKKGRVAIFPMPQEDTTKEEYDGMEYLGIYPYLTETINMRNELKLWVNDGDPKCYVLLDWWLVGKEPCWHAH